MITYEWNHNDLARIEKKLGTMKGEARKALRDAVNKTAVSARMQLQQAAQSRYTIKAGGFKASANIERATVGNLVATIKVKGAPPVLSAFRISRAKSGLRAQVLTNSGLKALVGPRGIKAFVATGGRVAGLPAQRRGPERFPLRVPHGPSLPKQFEMVYEGKGLTSTPLKEEIEKLYHKYVDQQIERFLNK